MKKTVALLLALLMLCMPALALTGQGYPQFDGALTENSLGGTLDGASLALAFDPSDDYSYLRDGYIQACFFAFDEAEEYYLELYMLLPEGVQSGDVLDPESSNAVGADSCSLTLFEVDENNAQEVWFSGQLLGETYPEISSFEITVDSVEYGRDSLAVSGSLSADLCYLEGELPGTELLPLDADFHFVLPLTAGEAMPAPETQPSESQSPEAKPQPVQPTPAFTLPPDYITL